MGSGSMKAATNNALRKCFSDYVIKVVHFEYACYLSQLNFSDCQRVAAGDKEGLIHIVGMTENEEKEIVWEELGTCQVGN